MRRALILLFLCVGCIGSAQMQKRPDVVLTSTRALILGPPMMVTGQNVVDLSASADGRYLVAMRSVPSPVPPSLERPQLGPIKKEILIWDSSNGETKTIQLPTDVRDGFSIDWFPNSARAILSVQFPFYSEETRPDGQRWIMSYGIRAWLLDAPSGKLQLVTEDKQPFVRAWSLNVSPTQNYGVMITDEETHAPYAKTVAASNGTGTVNSDIKTPEPKPITLRTITADGRLGTEVKLPLEYVFSGGNGWSADGREFLVEIQKIDRQARRSTPVILHFDPITGAFYDTIGAIAGYQERESIKPIALEKRLTQVGTGPEARPVLSWWLKSNEESKDMDALVVEHSERAIVAPGEKFVAYIVGGALFARTSVELSVAQYEEMLLAAQRSILISNAKQVALAAQMYAADYDDTLPPNLNPDEDLYPYLKNRDVLKGFVLTFPGGDLSKVENPAETVLGYIEGPGGRAVAYIDGHVKWIPSGGG